MTTIVWRDGVMAADGRVTDGQLVLTDDCQKIRKLSDGALFALAGEDTIEERLVEWLEEADGGIMPPQGKDFTAILVSAQGELSTYHGVGDRFAPWYGEYAAFGSGSEIAYGALEMGATADQAVAAAIRRNIYSGGPIQVETPGLPEQDED